MRRLRLIAAAIAAGLITVSSVAATGAAAATVNPAPEFRASRIEVAGPTNALAVSRDTAVLGALVKDFKNKPRPKVSVTFTVLSGPDLGYSESVSTTDKGIATTVKGIKNNSRPGTDAVQATFSDGLEIHKSQRVFVVWQSGPAARSVRSPARITLTPNCFQPATAAKLTSNEFRVRPKSAASGPPAVETGAITVIGEEFNPFSAVLVTFDAGPGGTPQSFSTRTDGFGRFALGIKVKEPAEGSHLVRADDFRQREADAPYTIPCFMPSLALYPPIGPPGFVAKAIGTGFPANTDISVLNWTKPDIRSPLPKVIRTNADGAFEYPVLVLYHDILGPRTLQAIVANPNGPNAGAAIEADAPFLVSLGRAQVPDFVSRR